MEASLAGTEARLQLSGSILAMTSRRVNRCPQCKSPSHEVECLEKNLTDLGVKARLTCKRCGHVWEGSVVNPDRERLGFPGGRSGSRA